MFRFLALFTTSLVALPVGGQASEQSLFAGYFDKWEDDKTSLDSLSPAQSIDIPPIIFTGLGESAGDAVSAALKTNPQIDLARAEEGVAKADRIGAIGRFLPSLEGSASYTDDSLRSSTLDTLEDRDGLTLGLTVSQPLFQGFTATNRYREASLRLSQARHTIAQTQQDVAFQASQAHANVILAREIVSHRMTNLKLVERQFEVTNARMKAGAQSRTGVEQARMRVAQAQVALEEAKATLAAREANYARIIGHTPPPALAVDTGNNIFKDQSYQDILRKALDKNPSLQSAKDGLTAARFAHHAAKGEFSPKVSLDGSYFQRDRDDVVAGTGANIDDDEYQLVARMRVPIFAQGQNISGLRRTKANIMSQEAQIEGLKLSLEEAVSRSWQEIEAAI
ncbi:MAG: TolC family protein, partial [Pseudomonadota bacterium]